MRHKSTSSIMFRNKIINVCTVKNLIMIIITLNIYEFAMGSFKLGSVIKPIINKITSDFKFYQIVIITNTTPPNDVNFLFYVFLSEVPTININLAKINQSSENQLKALPSLHYPRETSFYIMILSDEDNKSIYLEAKHMLHFFVQLSQKSPRPHCFVIYFNKKNSIESKLNKIFWLAWSQIFLEFTILEVKYDGLPAILIYNPFTDTYTKQNFTHLSMKQIFPDKLKNVYNYSLNILAFEYLPFIKIIRDSQGQVQKVDTLVNKVIDVFTQFLNFSLHYVESSKMPEFSITPSAFPIHYVHSEESMISSKVVMIGNYLMAVPIIKINTKYDVPYVLLFIPIISMLQVLLIIAARVFHLDTEIWNILNIIRISLGVPLPKMSNSISQRMLLIALIWISWNYSAELYAQLTKDNILVDYMSFDTYEDIYKSNFTVYVEELCYNYLLDSDNEYIVNLRPRFKIVKHFFDCLGKLKQHKDRICIIVDASIPYCHKYFKNIDGKDDIKLSKFTLISEPICYGFQAGSPYVIKFSGILQVIEESGILFAADRKIYNVEANVKIGESNNDDTDVFLKHLISILLFGSALSLSVFVLKILYKKCRMQLNKFLR